MYLFISALILALLSPADDATVVAAGPTCRAELKGVNLLTTVELPTGLAVEGPWRVAFTADEVTGDRYMLTVTLDHVVERDALTGERSVIPFPQPVRVAFEGATQEEVVRRAANVWCVTVMRAHENQLLDRLPESAPSRITALPRPVDAA